jgi:hypothetical protein
MPKSKQRKLTPVGGRFGQLQGQFIKFRLDVTHDIMLISGALQDLHTRLLALEPRKESDGEARNVTDPAPAGAGIRNPETAGQA